MAKKVIGQIKLQLPGGQATPAPPVGPALGQHGLNIMDFCNAFNARTTDQKGIIIPVIITVYADRTYSFISKTPPAFRIEKSDIAPFEATGPAPTVGALSVRVVDDIDQAIAHIASYGSGHTESIVTDNATAAEQFLREVDSAIVLQNASTQFADGGEFGMGAEIGIATGRIHARGPVGADQLTSYKYVVRGSGQVRP